MWIVPLFYSHKRSLSPSPEQGANSFAAARQLEKQPPDYRYILSQTILDDFQHAKPWFVDKLTGHEVGRACPLTTGVNS